QYRGQRVQQATTRQPQAMSQWRGHGRPAARSDRTAAACGIHARCPIALLRERGPWPPGLEQHHIELLLQVLLVGLEADALAEELLQLRHRGRLVLGDAR